MNGLTAGDTNAQAIQAIVNRYGSFVLLKPPVEPATYVLWYGPPLLLACRPRRHTGLAETPPIRRPADIAPLNPEESRRLDGLMRETDA